MLTKKNISHLLGLFFVIICCLSFIGCSKKEDPLPSAETVESIKSESETTTVEETKSNSSTDETIAVVGSEADVDELDASKFTGFNKFAIENADIMEEVADLIGANAMYSAEHALYVVFRLEDLFDQDMIDSYSTEAWQYVIQEEIVKNQDSLQQCREFFEEMSGVDIKMQILYLKGEGENTELVFGADIREG